MRIETAASIASAVVAWLVATGAFAGWYLNRRSIQLRRDDVLFWANEVIEVLQSIVLVCRLGEQKMSEDQAPDKMLDLVFRTSILVERGRLFFRNKPKGNFGTEKPPAYRGLRPRILDYLVMGHLVACEWPSANEYDRRRMGVIAEDAVRSFVSTAQREVGRSDTAFDGAADEGYGVHLPSLLNQIDEEMLQRRNWR